MLHLGSSLIHQKAIRPNLFATANRHVYARIIPALNRCPNFMQATNTAQAIQAATDALMKLPYVCVQEGSESLDCGSSGSMTVTLEIEVRLRWNQFDREWEASQ